jgi:hypothetical protein
MAIHEPQLRPQPAAAAKKIIPGKNTGDLLIKVLLTIKPYPMKRQTYGDIAQGDVFSPMVLNTLGTYFKKAVVNHLKFCMRGSFNHPFPRPRKGRRRELPFF